MKRSSPGRLHIHRATSAADVGACQALIAAVYGSRYGVTFGEEADPERKLEPLPDEYVLGIVGDELAVVAGLYTDCTYAEKFGQFTDEELQRALAVAGHPEAISRPRVEYTRLAVDPAWEGRGLGRHFLAATHSRAFLSTRSGAQIPLLLESGKISVFEHLHGSVGIRTRTVKPFPVYKSHERYRSADDPMETRLTIPEIDIDPRWFDFPLPGTLELHAPKLALSPAQ